MQAKPEFSAIAGPLLATSLLLLLAPASAHHEGGQHEVAKTAQARAPEAANAGVRADTGEAPSDPAGARLAATCTGCHGTNGRTVGDALPPLAGQPKQALLANLMAFKSGNRSATIMTQLVKGYSDADLERIAAFFANQPQPAREGPGS
jgi:cytochrome c553